MEDLNKVCLVGRLTKDPELRYTSDGKAIARFTLANGTFNEKKTNFIGCKAWGKLGEIVGEYATKGALVSISGRIETGTYEKEGRKYYTTDIICDFFKLLEKKGEKAASSTEGETEEQAEPSNAPDEDDDIPF